MDKANQLANEIHHQRKKKFPRRQVIVTHIDETWAMDLASMESFATENDGYKFILCVIDVFSKYAFCVPLKNKSATTVLDAVKKIISESERSPENFWVDRGTEWYNKSFQDYIKSQDMKMYSTHGESKAVVAERFIKTIKDKIYKYFTSEQTHNWIKVLPGLVKTYNNTKHSTIKMTPVEASKDKNQIPVFLNLTKPNKKRDNLEPKFKVGDLVRISRLKETFEKGYAPTFTYEVFKVSKVIDTSPVTYKIEDYHGKEIQGSFYEPELLKTKVPDYYLVEKILETRKKGKKKRGLREVSRVGVIIQ